ncbi:MULTISPECIES: N-6 DNA methylase [Ruegeria]|uniref:N-6 DNA methylase n=1 Tax=Ruegeria TaxID=97050 RepID=UPI00209D3687|nr:MULTISPECIES: N-6 DNA methylase [Ruegeria]
MTEKLCNLLHRDTCLSQPGDHICDPTCGSASLLMKCGKLIRDKGGKGYALFGQEAIGSTWALAKMNLFLHGEVNHQVEWGDTTLRYA